MNILNLLTKLVTNPSTRSPLLIIGLAAVATIANAAESPPSLMTVQSYITNDAGDPLGDPTSENKAMQFIIFTAEEGGESVFAEAQTVTVDKGYFSAILGEGTAISGPEKHNLSNAFSGSTASERYIEIQVDNGGADFQKLSPRLRLLPTAYSFLASYANVAGSVDNAVINTAALDDGAVTSAKVSDNTLTVNDLGTDSVNYDEIAAGAVRSSEVLDNSLTSDDLGVDSVNYDEIAAGAVRSSEVLDNSLTSDDLGVDSVNYDEIAAGAVRSAEVLNNSLTYNDLAENSVRSSELAPDLQLEGNFGVNTRLGNVVFTLQAKSGDDFLIYGRNSAGSAVYYITTSGTVWSASDRELKTDIKPLGNLLSKVLKLKPSTYRFKSLPESNEQLGFIAQDVMEVFPEIVDNDGGNLALSYQSFGAIAIGAIQELNEKIELQEAQNAALEERLTALETLVQSLAK
ncbi:MAG: hypothetical protein ACI92G_001753 [Candidatus Pelagisphaera sp.]|jgi:hypothetical protein